jgi:uncharacterized membrane protein
MADSISRSIAKSFTWRITATITTILIAYFITGNVETAVMIGGVEFFAKMFIYFLHERLWTSIPKLDKN